MQEWKKIGQILIENGILSPKTVDRVLEASQNRNRRFGWTLEKLGLVTGAELADALARQYDLKIASNLTRFSYSQEVLDLVAYEAAIENLIFPLKLTDGVLLLAVADPTNMKVVDNLAANCGMPVIPCVATRSDIYAAICKYYLNRKMTEPTKNTVLIVEDEATSLESARVFLTKANYKVLTARDGLEAFKEIITSKPHVVITDKVMPKLDGFALLKSVRAIPELQSIPIILMSDKLTPQEEVQVFDIGFFDYIPKPLNMITLISRVKRAFRYCNQKYDFF